MQRNPELPPEDLRVARQAGLDLEPIAEVGEGAAVFLDNFGTLRPRPHDGHVALQDVDQLGQLVDAEHANPPAHRRDAAVVLFGVLRAAALRVSGARHVRLDPAAGSVAFDESGVELNFGAIGKGIALDCAATTLENEGLGSFLLQGGKSGVIARGGRKNDFSFATSALIRGASTLAPTHEEDDEIDEESGLRRRRRGSTQKDAQIALDALFPDFGDDAFFEPPSNEPVGWTIGVSHPLHPDRRLAELWLRDKALATSGSTWQFFRSGGKRYSHIIDPRTGYPSFGVLSATVLAPTATEADALSTAFFVAGATFTESYCAKRKDVAAFLVLEEGENGGYELASFNFEPGTLRLVDGR